MWEFLEVSGAWLWAQVKALKPSFISKNPHFNFISAHYFWIVGMSILGSILLFATAGGKLAYIDALFLSSGANTQAGLNTVDVNSLNTFGQVVLFLCAMTSNPITIHTSVVFLRLYWFEKRFQDWVRSARNRRTTIAKSRSKAKADLSRAEQGVNGRDIARVPDNGGRLRMTNDGILLDPKDDGVAGNGVVGLPHMGERRRSSRGPPGGQHGLDAVPEKDERLGSAGGAAGNGEWQTTQPQISFAEKVKRSDGMEDQETSFPTKLSNEQTIAFIQRQRVDDDDEVLVIPGPMESDAGTKPSVKPRRVEHDDSGLGDMGLVGPRLRRTSTGADSYNGSPVSNGIGRGRSAYVVDDNSPGTPMTPTTATATTANPRHQTIIWDAPDRRVREEETPQAEPDSPGRRMRDELADEARAISNTFAPMWFRKPRLFQQGNTRYHTDDDSDEKPSGSAVTRVASRTLSGIQRVLTHNRAEDPPYLSWTPTLGRNSQFPGLTLEQREELGGIEYRSLRTLALVLVCYFWGFWFLSLACMLPWILNPSQTIPWGRVVDSAGVTRTWWGFFTSNSAFMDLGFTLTPDSMNSFNTAIFPLLVMSFFIIIGNTGFPIMLRAIIWVLARLVPVGTGIWEELRFLLDHPRRCFTLLFPSGATWWLFWTLFGLNAVDLIVFCVLDIHNEVVSSNPVGIRIVDGLFQAASTRTAGFSCVNLALLHPAVQCSYMIMMYISVLPIAISIRRTNVYEEKSLGIYHNAEEENPNENSAMSYVATHLRRQLSFDLWYVFLGLFILAISEGGRIQSGDFNLFAVLFEIVSAYGTVGLSLGYPNVNASLCSQFSTVGKLVIIAMQIRGRHRGLPYGLDRAILLPSESRFEKEAMEAHPVIVRTATAMSAGTTGRRTSLSGAGRGRSRSADRGIITQFLHPGPSIPHHEPFSKSTGVSAHKDSNSNLGSFSMEGPMKRAVTQPVDDDTDLSPWESRTLHPQVRRAETSPGGRTD